MLYFSLYVTKLTDFFEFILKDIGGKSKNLDAVVTAVFGMSSAATDV